MFSPSRRDALTIYVLRFLTSISAGIIVLVALFIAKESTQAFGPSDSQFQFSDLVMDETWNPSAGQYDLKPMVAGTLLTTLGALLLTAPLGIGMAVFLNFYLPQSASWFIKRVVEMLAGVPSVVYGLWGLSVLVPLIAEWSPLEQGQSLLAGVLILTFMTLPTVVVAVDASIRQVPVSCYHGAHALGLGRRAIAWSVVLPHARWGIVSAVILQVARAIGETMAVLMVCGNIVQVPGSVFAPIRTLTANIALEMGYADEHHRSILFLSGLLGLVLVSGLMLTANFVSTRNRK